MLRTLRLHAIRVGWQSCCPKEKMRIKYFEDSILESYSFEPDWKVKPIVLRAAPKKRFDS